MKLPREMRSWAGFTTVAQAAAAPECIPNTWPPGMEDTLFSVNVLVDGHALDRLPDDRGYS